MKLGERYLANIFYNRTTGPHFRVWRKCKQCCGIQTITFWRLAGKYLYCLHHVFAYICYLAFSFCKGWSGSQNLQPIINEAIHLFWALRQILEIFWRVSYLVLDATSWWLISDEDEVPYVNQGGGGGLGTHVGAAVGKTEYTIFCLWIVKSNDRT